MIDDGVPRDGKQPGRELRDIPLVSAPFAPGLLKRAGCNVLGKLLVAQAVSQKVVDPWELLGEHQTPVRLPGYCARQGLSRLLHFRAHYQILRTTRRSITASDKSEVLTAVLIDDRGWLVEAMRSREPRIVPIPVKTRVPMGRPSITGGVTPANGHRIQFDFSIDGVRYRPTLRREPTEANLR